MSLIPILKSKEIIAALLRAGFRVMRQTGSHVRLQHIGDAKRQTTVPQHSADIPRWLLKQILKQTKISLKEFLKLLRK